MSEKKPGWLRRRLASLEATGRRVMRDPKQVGVIARERAIRLWMLRGGGWYGLGYVITFIVLEIRMVVADAVGSDDVVTFLGQQALEMVFRFASQSFLNGLLAFLWPAFVLEYMGGWGIVVLVGSWWIVGRFVAPRLAKLVASEEEGQS